MKFFATLILFSILSIEAFAGTNCEKKEPDPVVLIQAAKHAAALTNKLNKLNPQVALIARVGSDISKYGLYYTHVAFVVRDYAARKGEWTVIHLLNQCGTDHSSIYAQGLMNFFMDDLYNMDFEIIVPTKTTQQSIQNVLHSRLMLKLHSPNYNMVAYPFSTRYQNSNQWVLEVLASAISGAKSRGMSQRVLAKTHYVASTIHVDLFSVIGAKMFKANVRFDDHPQEEQQMNTFSIVSVKSVVNYLQAEKALSFIQSYR